MEKFASEVSYQSSSDSSQEEAITEGQGQSGSKPSEDPNNSTQEESSQQKVASNQLTTIFSSQEKPL